MRIHLVWGNLIQDRKWIDQTSSSSHLWSPGRRRGWMRRWPLNGARNPPHLVAATYPPSKTDWSYSKLHRNTWHLFLTPQAGQMEAPGKNCTHLTPMIELLASQCAAPPTSPGWRPRPILRTLDCLTLLYLVFSVYRLKCSLTDLL